ncbi:MAG: class I SAM-dependent methyltransferase [Blastocatellales bacterium]
MFKDNYIPENELSALYSHTDYYSNTDSESVAQGEINVRKDYAYALRVIRSQFQGGQVLDIGCSTGLFLALLDDRYIKHGVELSEAARVRARDRGINIIGKSVGELVSTDRAYDVITLFDVIEHIPYPVMSLNVLVRMLKTEGIILISTGNTSALTWKLMLNSYWYYLPEHVCFFNKKWFKWYASQQRLKVIHSLKYSHVASGLKNRASSLIYALMYFLYNKLSGMPLLGSLFVGLYPINKVKYWHCPPRTYSWKDHILIVLQKCN